MLNDIGHGALGIGHWVLGIGHWALGMGRTTSSIHLGDVVSRRVQ
ncbi:hypothetical protein [Tolypothrix sp. FACHB-123]|nr:hypothetical protein [Tolypothrix sp. FACHB-123]